METQQRESVEVQFNQQERLYHDTTTWLAEALEGFMANKFEYTFDGNELYSSDGTPIGTIFKDAIADAKKLGPELSFEHRRRLLEHEEYQEMLDMMSGSDFNTMVVISDFPPELMNAQADVGGYNASRKQTMLRVLSKTTDDKLHMESQTLDASNRDGLEAIYSSLGFIPAEGELLGQRMHLQLAPEDQEFLKAQLTGVYDRKMEEQFGGVWHAGRKQGKKLNTYDFVLEQQDLLTVYFDSVEKFGEQPGLLGDIVATMDRRYDARLKSDSYTESTTHYYEDSARHVLMQEMLLAGQRARQIGKTYSGCGLTVGQEDDTDDQFNKLGFGNKSEEDNEEDDYGPLKFKCKNGHSNKRPRGKLISQCKVKSCRNSVSC